MKISLIVGIDDYEQFPLTGCVNDANSIAKILEKNADGSPNLSNRLLVSTNETITRSILRKSIEQLFSTPSELALLYFAGHGFIKPTGGYLVTTDASSYDEGVSMDEILGIANSSQAKNKIIILDCCHSGNFGNPTTNGDNKALLSEGLSILTACRSSESSLENNGAGIFTSLLKDALNGGASDIRGNITPGSLYAYVDEALSAWDQRPIFKSNVSSFATLRKVLPKVSLETLRKITDYFPSSQDEYQLDPSYEFTSTSSNAEHVEIFKNLQKFQSVGLVVPVDAEYMYFATMESKSCRLTAIGHQYWRLVNERKL
jgi:hypothetical protein